MTAPLASVLKAVIEMQGGMYPSERGGMPQYRACLIGYPRQDISRGVTVDLLSMYLILAHDDPRVGAAYKVPTVDLKLSSCLLHRTAPGM
jgi:hypothetical protein